MSNAIWSVLFFLIGAALLKFAFYLVDSPENPIWLWCVAIGCGACAFLLILQATLLGMLLI